MPEVLNQDVSPVVPGDPPTQNPATPQVDHHANDHLDRLFAADKAEIPWFISLYQNIHDVIKPEKLPPLMLTSKPVAVKDIWGLYRPDPKSFMTSGGMLLAIFALLMIGATNKKVQDALKQSVTIIDPHLTAFKPDVKPAGGGGGGGDRSIKPVTKGQLPKPALKQFVPPMIVKNEPKLAMDPSILAPPDTVLPQSTLPNWGDPLAKLGDPSNGTGLNGMGDGRGGGVGSGKGGGYGPGEGGGIGGGVFKAGGGVSLPQVVYKAEAEFSEEARKAKYQGIVVLSVVVLVDGSVGDIHVVKSLGMGLDEKAVEAIKKWKFKPGMKGGQPVNVRANIEINFHLL
jgi:protein TonB